MKVLSKEDLLLLVTILPNNSYSEYDLQRLLEKFGDDWYVEGNKIVKFTDNENMEEVRRMYSERKENGQ